MNATPSPPLRIGLLGAFSVNAPSGEAAPSIPGRLRRLLAHLALHDGYVDRTVLAAEMWPDELDEDARANLRRQLHALGQVLETLGFETPILRSGSATRLSDAVRSAIDVVEYRAMLSQDHTRGTAVERWTDPSLAVGDDEWLDHQNQQLRHDHVLALQRLLDGAVLRGDAGEIVRWANRILDMDLEREDALRTAMRALADLGKQSEAERSYRAFEQRLRAELDAAPQAETLDLYRSIGEGAERWPATLPAERTPFFAREAEVAAVCDAVVQSRVVTIIGAAGAGKSRIMLRAAARLARRFREGVRYVDASTHETWEALSSELVDVLSADGVPMTGESTALRDVCRSRELLVVIDNCERIGSRMAHGVQQILASPATRVLLSSRGPLHLEGEFVYSVDPFSREDAVEFFLNRAASIAANIHRTPETMQSIAQICEELDGLPLALEFAALRLPVLGLPTLRLLLAHRFNVLTALESAYDLSYNLLDSVEQRVFRRLGVLSGEWTIDVAERVCGLSMAEIAEPLARLAQLSLIHRCGGIESPTLTTLRSTREYMLERLQRAGEAEIAWRVHMDVFLGWLVERNNELRGAKASTLYSEVDRRSENIRSSLGEAILRERDIELGTRALNALSRYWFDRNRIDEGSYWYVEAIQRLSVPSMLRAESKYCQALLGRNKEPSGRTLAALESAIEELRSCGDVGTTAKALLHASNAARLAGKIERARDAANEALLMFRERDDQYLEGFARTTLGAVEYSAGNLEAAQKQFESALKVFREFHASADEALMLTNIGHCLLLRGHLDEARRFLQRGLDLGGDTNNYYGAQTLIGLALLDMREGNVEGARQRLAQVASVALTASDLELSVVCIEAAAELFSASGNGSRALGLLETAEMTRRAAQITAAPLEAAWMQQLRSQILRRHTGAYQTAVSPDSPPTVSEALTRLTSSL